MASGCKETCEKGKQDGNTGFCDQDYGGDVGRILDGHVTNMLGFEVSTRLDELQKTVTIDIIFLQLIAK